MRIGYNAQILADASTGVARYAEEMLRALSRLNKVHELVVFGNRKRLAGVCPEDWIVPTSDALNSAGKRILWEQTILPVLQKKHRLNVMYYPDHTASVIGGWCRTVITVHDLVPFAMPSAHGVARTTYKRLMLRRSASRADRIVAVSEATRNDCVRWLGVDPEKVVVIYNGVHEHFSRVTDHSALEEVRRRYGLSRRFILFVGTIEERKNVGRLIEAYDTIRSVHEIEVDLVLAGGTGKGFSQIKHRATQSPWQEGIKFVGFVPETDLPALYSMAEVLAYPSLYEGFGLPVLEAMACECPVVTSQTTSLPEVVDEAGILVDPYDPILLADALAKVLTSHTLRTELQKAGKLRAREFSWNAAASRLMNLVESLVYES